MRTNKNVYSEYTLSKVKNFILKHVDKIELIGGDMYLYFPKNDNFKFFKQNNSIIEYILNDTINFKTLGEYIVNKNLIKRIEITSSPCGEGSAHEFENIFKVILQSDNISTYYPYDKETLKFLQNFKKSLTNKP